MQPAALDRIIRAVAAGTIVPACLAAGIAIATGGLKRAAVLPKIPTVAETLPGFESVGWYGVLVPAGTPPDIVAKLNTEINRGLKDLHPVLLRDGAETIGGTPEDFARHFRAEMTKWAALLGEIGLKPM